MWRNAIRLGERVGVSACRRLGRDALPTVQNAKEPSRKDIPTCELLWMRLTKLSRRKERFPNFGIWIEGFYRISVKPLLRMSSASRVTPGMGSLSILMVRTGSGQMMLKLGGGL
jgi:hypothetical protein